MLGSERNQTTFRLHLGDGRWEQRPRATMRRRFLIDCYDRSPPDDAAVLVLPEKNCRHLVTMRFPEVNRYWAEIDGALVMYEDWGNVTIDGLLDEAASRGLIEDLVANLRRLTGADWTFEQEAEYRG